MFHELMTSLSSHRFGIFGPLLEILIISAFVYLILYFMRGTRGAGMLRGLAVIYLCGVVGVLGMAHIFQLENIRWIMEYAFAFSIIAIIITFQPELRRALIRLGETPVWSLFHTTGKTTIDELVKAAINLSKKNHGSLIVIERDTKLGNYIEGGIAVDAPVSSELLATIFTPKTPLHDGAAIIRKGRIMAANCLLPFTENTAICRGMGARHRAGIGLSEESDAVIIIVSEETGHISTAIKGQIVRDLDATQLRNVLRENCPDEAGSELWKGDGNA